MEQDGAGGDDGTCVTWASRLRVEVSPQTRRAYGEAVAAEDGVLVVGAAALDVGVVDVELVGVRRHWILSDYVFGLEKKKKET